MDSEGFSQTGLIVWGSTLGILAVLIIIAVFATALFGGRHRLMKSCGVFFAGALIATPVLLVAGVIAMFL